MVGESAAKGRALRAFGRLPVALVAAALEPEAISGVQVHDSWRTLRDVLDRNVSAQQMPAMSTFGLPAEPYAPQIQQLIAPRSVGR